jgi:hypothetical protein
MILVRVLNLKFLRELAAQMIGTSSSPHWQLYDSSVALDLTFLRMTRDNAGRNVKSAIPARTIAPGRDIGRDS